jgi:hypothetical protein
MINMGIRNLYEKYLKGESGDGSVLFHKHPHESPLCEGLCVLGTKKGCINPINCPNLYSERKILHCLELNEPVNGILIQEEKHKKLVDRGAPGAYASLREALCDLA